MDQQSDMPKINPDVNREEEKEEERKPGFLAGLFSRIGARSGGWGGSAGAGLSGGLLATKAGIIGLVLVGTTVAGSIGVVGYKLFGPTAADRADADFSSIFSVKPRSGQAASDEGANSVSADGASQSLSYLAQANARQGDGSGDGAAAPGAAPASGDSSAAASGAPFKNDNAPGQGPAAKLKTDKKFGELSKGFGAGGGSGTSASAPAVGAGALLANAKGGNLGSFANAARPTAAGRALRGMSASRNLSAYKQLGNVMRDQRGASSSQAAGRTYDGNSQAASTTGGDPGTIGGGTGASGTSADASPTVTPTSANATSTTMPSVTGVNVTPWQGAINTSLMMVVAAITLLFLADKVGKMTNLGPYAKWLAMALAGIAALLGLAVIAFGAIIGGGKFGQVLQGQILTLAGGFVTATAGLAIYGLANTGALSGGVLTLMYACGGAALAACAWAYMSTPKKYSSGYFKDGQPPDWDHKYEAAQVVEPASDSALRRYLTS